MDENLEENRPLTEEERRENLRKLLGEDKADNFFDATYIPTLEVGSGLKTSRALPESNSLVNWKLIGVFAVIFILVLIGAGYVTGPRVQEETVDAPTSLVPQNGGTTGEQPTK